MRVRSQRSYEAFSLCRGYIRERFKCLPWLLYNKLELRYSNDINKYKPVSLLTFCPTEKRKWWNKSRCWPTGPTTLPSLSRGFQHGSPCSLLASSSRGLSSLAWPSSASVWLSSSHHGASRCWRYECTLKAWISLESCRQLKLKRHRQKGRKMRTNFQSALKRDVFEKQIKTVLGAKMTFLVCDCLCYLLTDVSLVSDVHLWVQTGLVSPTDNGDMYPSIMNTNLFLPPPSPTHTGRLHWG